MYGLRSINANERRMVYAWHVFTWHFPCKCAFFNVTGAKSMMASSKKFYKLMVDKGLVEKEDYDEMIDEMRARGEEFLRHCDEYFEDDFF